MATPTQFAFRTLKGIGVVNAAPTYEPLAGFERPLGNLRCSTYSPDGRFFAWASPDNVTVVDASVGSVVATLTAANVYELGFSPLGTYIITWQRPGKDETGNAIKNLKVWTVEDTSASSTPGEEHNVVGRFVQKSQTGWNLQYTPDEKLCARVVSNEVQFYESHDLGTVWRHLRVEGVSDFALPAGQGSNTVAVFVPEKKGQPASVRVFTVPDFDGAPVSQKNFYKGDKVQLKWNAEGTSLIVLAQTEVDKSNQNYYGETTLYLLSAAPGGFDARIDLDKEGPIHDVAWSPNSREFGVVYGFTPAKTVIFNQRARAVHTFPLAPRNTISYSPHARFVLVAGFGNMAGDVDVYDLERDYARVSSFKASSAAVCDWSPDGQHLLTAIVSPRLRVDNGIRIWHLSGAVMYNADLAELYTVAWRPQAPAAHPAPPPDPLQAVPPPHASALDVLAQVKTPSKPVGAYRPPGARGTATPLSFMREDQGGAVYVREGGGLGAPGSGGGRPRNRSIPGAEAADSPTRSSVPGAAAATGEGAAGGGGGAADEGLSAAAVKNKKKREAKKAKAAAEKDKAAAAATSLAPNGEKRARSSSRRREPGEDRQRSRSRGAGEWGPSDKSEREGWRSKSRDGRDGGDPRDGRDGRDLRDGRDGRAGTGDRSRRSSRNGEADTRSSAGRDRRDGAGAGTNGERRRSRDDRARAENGTRGDRRSDRDSAGTGAADTPRKDRATRPPDVDARASTNGPMSPRSAASNAGSLKSPTAVSAANGPAHVSAAAVAVPKAPAPSPAHAPSPPAARPAEAAAAAAPARVAQLLPLKIDTAASRSSAAAGMKPSAAGPAMPVLEITTPGGGTGSPADKKIRALTKKLRAIDELKMRRAGGEKLEATQLMKMETEEGVRRELEGLGGE